MKFTLTKRKSIATLGVAILTFLGFVFVIFPSRLGPDCSGFYDCYLYNFWPLALFGAIPAVAVALVCYAVYSFIQKGASRIRDVLAFSVIAGAFYAFLPFLDYIGDSPVRDFAYPWVGATLVIWAVLTILQGLISYLSSLRNKSI